MNQSKQKQKTQQKKKQNTGESMTIKKDSKDGNYDILSKTELIKQIRNKDRCIAQLQQGLNTKGNSQSEKVNMYRLKLEDEIAQNQKAVKAFGSITEIIISIISKFKGLDQINKSSLANVRGIHEEPKDILEKSGEQQEQNEQSQFSCFDQIVDETLKLLEHLSKLTDQNMNSNIRLKTQLSKAKSDLEKKQSLIPPPLPVKREAQQQINLLKQQITQIILQNKDLKKVLLRNQQQKNKVLISISTALTQQQMQELSKESKQQLLQRIRRMTYRIKELQKDKKQIFIKAKVQKQVDEKKFKDLLKQIKQVKQIRVNKKMSLSGI